MAYAPRTWAGGIAPLALLWIAATYFETPWVEKDLSLRADMALGVHMLNAATTLAAGRDVSIGGRTFASEGAQTAVEAVLGTWGVRLTDATGTAPLDTGKPYVWNAVRDGAKLTLGGMTPNPDLRESAIAAARKISGATVVDAMTYTAGAPANEAAGQTFALALLGGLASGKAELSDGALTLSGATPDGAGFEKLLIALKTPPAGITLAKADVAPPPAKPFTFHATVFGDDVALTGSAPTPDARDAIIAKTKTLFPGFRLHNTLSLASGQSEEATLAVAGVALTTLANLHEATAKTTDMTVDVSGTANTLESYESALAVLGKLPEGVQLGSADVTPPLVKPYAFSLAAAAGTVSLSGYAPSRAVRGDLEARAARVFPGAKIENGLKPASGASEKFIAAGAYAMEIAGKLDGVRANVIDDVVSISGRARTTTAYDEVLAALASPPSGVKIANADVTPPLAEPYVFDLIADASGVTLQGDAPSAAARSALEAAAARAFGGIVSNKLVIASGEPLGFSSAVDFALAQAARLEDAHAQLTNLDLVMTGRAKDSAGFAATGAALAAAPSGLYVKSAEIIAPLAKPYTFSLAAGGGSVALSGSAPSEAVHGDLTARAARVFPGAKIEDGLKPASGASAYFPAASAYALNLAGKLDGVRADVIDDAVSLSGRAKSAAAYNDVLAALSDPPTGVQVARAEVTPPLAAPYVFDLIADASGVTLRGDAPSAAARSALETVVAKAFGGKVDDKLIVASGEPLGFANAVQFAILQSARLMDVHARLSNLDLAMSGRAKDLAGFDAINAALAAAPGGVYVTAAEIIPPLAAPYIVSVARQGDRVVLSGHAPSAAVGSAIAKATGAAFSGAKVESSLTPASGAPAGDFASFVRYLEALVADLPDGKATLTDTSVAVAGRPSDLDSLDRIAARIAKPLAGLTIAKSEIAMPILKPLVVDARMEGDALKLTGTVPNEAARRSIAALAAKSLPGAKIDNGLAAAPTARPPAEFSDALAFVFGALKDLEHGVAHYDESHLALSGEGLNAGSLGRIGDAAKALGQGVNLDLAALAPHAEHPFKTEAIRSGGELKLTGAVPDVETRAALVTFAKSVAGASRVVDDLHIAGGVPDLAYYVSAMRLMETALAAAYEGRAALTDREIRVTAACCAAGVDSAVAQKAIADAAAGLNIAQLDVSMPAPSKPAEPEKSAASEKPAEVVKPEEPGKPAEAEKPSKAAEAEKTGKTEEPTAPLSVDQCQTGLLDKLQGSHIEFETAKANISASSEALIRDLASIARRCAEAQIEIAGHTDNTGSDALNVQLSHTRAQAVVSALVKLGVPEGRLSAKGYGSSHPIASNDTDADRAENRRIEFVVKK